MRSGPHLPSRRGFTLIEVMVTVAILLIIITLAAPSFKNMIEMQRLRSITAQLVTDLQYARNEAVSRNTRVNLSFQANAGSGMTCYLIYTSANSDLASRCNCEVPAASACPAGSTQIKTVQIPDSQGVRVEIPISTEYDTAFAFDHITGGLYVIPTDDFAMPWDGIKIESYLDETRKLAVKVNRAGRPSVCTPDLSRMTEQPCAP
jgi:prepilin-type N-terminal cleavage/methylation domain-containing protein